MKKFKSLFAEQIENMISYRQALGYSRSTYESRLALFDEYCFTNYPEQNVLTKELVQRWIEKYISNKEKGIPYAVGAVRLFGQYLQSIGVKAYVIPKNFFKKKVRYTPYILTDQLHDFFCATDDIPDTSKDDFRKYVFPILFRLMYVCGLRPNEARELKRSNIHFDTGEILITKTKYRKERIVVAGEDMLLLLNRYNNLLLIKYPDSEYFFPNTKGNVYANSTLYNICRDCWVRANPEKNPEELPRIRPYDFRHRYGSAVLNKWLDEKVDLYAMLPYLRTFMGHSELSSTAYYIHLLPENLTKSSGIDWDNFNKMIPEVDTW